MNGHSPIRLFACRQSFPNNSINLDFGMYPSVVRNNPVRLVGNACESFVGIQWSCVSSPECLVFLP